MTSLHRLRCLIVFVLAWCVAGLLAPGSINADSTTLTKQGSTAKTRTAPNRTSSNKARKSPSCLPCQAQASHRSKQSRSRKAVAQKLPCHSKDYLDPKIRNNYQAALREMKRERLKPKVTSYWRSSEDQARLHRCSLSRRCRLNHPGLYRAMPPGKSIHEAGFAVDIAGVATGPRGAKRLTPQGRRTVAIMKRHGFNWPYGLKDPVHFEASPQRYGYKTVKQAIKRNQSVCDVKLAREKKQTRRSRSSLRAQLTPASKQVGQEKRLRTVADSVKPRRTVSKSRA
ncbi:MAG TPA: D-alanyl-D-alanine carboxypeptidase family protein [Blastocatellia bacterium]|nr:D-alanyl-D-alanine carboxypeptidase family protein [Blastocatellia bacterium]